MGRLISGSADRRRTMVRGACVAGLLALLTPGVGGGLKAQQRPALAPEVPAGARVRARLSREFRGSRPAGRLITFDSAHLVLGRAGRADTVATAAVERLEVSVGPGRGRAGPAMIRGALIGAVVGGVLGWNAARRCHGGDACDLDALAVPLGAALGLGLGAPAGLLVRGEGWRTVWQRAR